MLETVYMQNFQKLRHFLFVVSGIFLVLFIGIFVYNAVGIGVSIGNLCASIVHSRTMSPDKSRELVSFSVDCGAASSGKNYQIALVRLGEERPDKNGKVFFFGSPESYDVIQPQAEWETEKSIRVYFSGLINLYKLDLEVENIKINYGPRVNRSK